MILPDEYIFLKKVVFARVYTLDVPGYLPRYLPGYLPGFCTATAVKYPVIERPDKTAVKSGRIGLSRPVTDAHTKKAKHYSI